MSLDWLATRGGQLLGCYTIAALLVWSARPDADTVGKLLFLVIGAVLRDMQDNHTSSQIINSPGARSMATAPEPPKKETT